MKKTYTEKAIQMVLLDAIEKGHTDKNELNAYMASDTFDAAVKRYVELMVAEFGE